MNSSNMRTLSLSRTSSVFHTPFPVSKEKISVMMSPLVSTNAWEALIKKTPLVCAEEYQEGKKDKAAKLLLSFFKEIPFIVQTKRTQNILKEIGFSKLFLIPPTEEKKNSSKNRNHILWVGRLVENKNPFLFLKLAEHFKNENFVMIGSGELSKEIDEKAKSLPNLKVINKVEKREDLFKYYSEAKLLIHPAWKDPIGHVIIEALSTQTPVFASSKAGASDFLPKEWIAEPGNEQEWIEKTKAILANQQESIGKAEEIFEKEHLNIDDPYFEGVAKNLSEAIRKKWPHLFEEGP